MSMVRSSLALAAVTLAAAATTFPVAAAHAGVTDDTTAYVWADQPTAASYIPSKPYSYNNLGGTNVITRLGTGQWLVTFGSLGVDAASSGTVDVTPYGSTPATCSVDHWTPSGSDAAVYVDCYDLTGAPLDTLYTVDFTSLREPLFPFNESYVWANDPTNHFYTPDLDYQYRDLPLAGSVTVDRFTTGEYLVSFPELSTTNEGAVKVTPYGPGGGYCTLAGFNHSSGTATQAEVWCFAPDGTPQDRRFTATWTTGSLDGTAFQYAYALASKPTKLSYKPLAVYQADVNASKTGSVHVDRTGTGSYDVSMPVLPRSGGNVQVSTVFTPGAHCQVQDWFALNPTGPGEKVQVACFNSSGARTDAQFAVQWERS
jgi:hypothetical protein